MSRLPQCRINHLAGNGILLLLQNGGGSRLPTMRMGQISCRDFLTELWRYSNTATRLHQKIDMESMKTIVNKGLWPCARGQNASAGAPTHAGEHDVAIKACSAIYHRSTGISSLQWANSEFKRGNNGKRRNGDRQWNY